jgi:hypothetical protein
MAEAHQLNEFQIRQVGGMRAHQGFYETSRFGQTGA